MDTLPLKFALELYAGDDDPFIVIWTDDNDVPIDLTGYTAKMQFKTDKCGPAVFESVGVIATPTTGEIVFPISGAEKTALIIDCQTTCYHYDVELIQGGTALTLLYGTVRVRKDVTT